MAKDNPKANEVNQTGLYWPEKRTEVDRVILPFQTVETINESKADRDELTLFRQMGEPTPGWRNKLIWGDNKYIMASLLPEFAGKINLIYIDPPFFTGTDQTINLQISDDLTVTKERSIIEEAAYRNIWRYGTASYFQWIYDRLSLMRELLSRNGMIFIRHDQYWSHYVKVIADEVFGKGNFQNEIVVKRIYKNVTRQGRISIPIATDSLFVYFKSMDAHYFDIYKKLSQTRESYWRALDDSSGIRRPPERKILGKVFYPPPGKHFKFSQNKIDALMEEGRIRINPETGRPQYLVAPADAIVLNSNWTDISGYSFTSGYPTENSEDLLERVIKAGSESGDLVADFFCGSGTTLAVAEKLGRRWIGADLSKFAIHTTRKRLLGIPGCQPFEVLNLGKYEKAKLKENGNLALVM
ncbi:adenine-specific DNA-methyltransferase [Candidatus Hakubella thermalkaliphila]|uniref:Adenine-specific DNA-methyltransferase n=1 Tax=Candidatus Hakubella thermalkaliphila TaxID=2754717 RepID=A0A6V8NY98_9ACTN|nr:adenine-specific DNA-methyltransferase [Candidatus Hakubella thermalkaliphila]